MDFVDKVVEYRSLGDYCIVYNEFLLAGNRISDIRVLSQMRS